MDLKADAATKAPGSRIGAWGPPISCTTDRDLRVEEPGSERAMRRKGEPHPGKIVRMSRGTKALARRLGACEPLAEGGEVPAKVNTHLDSDREEEGLDREWARWEARLDRRKCNLRHRLLQWPRKSPGADRSQPQNLDVGGQRCKRGAICPGDPVPGGTAPSSPCFGLG